MLCGVVESDRLVPDDVEERCSLELNECGLKQRM